MKILSNSSKVNVLNFIKIIIIINLIILFIEIDSVYSFSHPLEESNDMYFDTVANSTNIKKKAEYILYDNILQKYNISTPIISLYNGKYVFVYKIDLDYPIHSASRLPLNIDNSLSRQIYANLKLKKILIEYEMMRKNHTHEFSNIFHMKKASGNIDGKNISYYGKKRSLLREYNHIIDSDKHQHDVENEYVLKSLSSGVNKDKIDFTTISEPIGNENHNDYNKKKFANQKPKRETDWNNEESPWLISKILDIKKYIINNPSEFLIYCATFILFISIFSGRKR